MEVEDQNMETIYYKCDKCGYSHQVPSYWSGHNPEEQLEMMHLDFGTKEICENQMLKLEKEV